MKFVPMPDEGIYRAGRWDDIEKFPPPGRQIDMRQPLVDGYRWDDATGRISTVTCSGSAEAAIGRSIARYRPRVVGGGGSKNGGTGIISVLHSWLEGPPDQGDPDLIDGRVPPDVLDDLYLLSIPSEADVVFVDLMAEETLDDLSGALGPVLTALGLDFPGADFSRSLDRRGTRLAVSYLQNMCSQPGDQKVAGLRYPGHPDQDWQAYVVWSEPNHISLTGDDVLFRWIAKWDDDLESAAAKLGITIPEG
jgi:hypothetical protein